MKKIGNFLRDYWTFDVFSFVAIALIIASFVVPPTGQIDPSVLAATGEIFAFAALYVVLVAVDKGVPASVSHGNTTVSVNKEEAEQTEV